MFLGGLVACILDNTVKGKTENFSSVQRACKRAWRIAHYSERIHFRGGGRGSSVCFYFCVPSRSGSRKYFVLIREKFSLKSSSG